MPAIELEGVARHYGERPALQQLSLDVGDGQTLVVFGPNGAGKTTLLRVLAALLRPHGGRARVLDCQLPGQAWRLRGRVGLLAHEPLLYRELTARENLRFHARLHGVARGRVDALIDRVGLHDRADERLATLSRGTVQRVAACRTVLHDPELLLLDEPFAHLDPQAVALLEPLIGRSSGRTRVLTSHHPAEGLAAADAVLGLRGGRAALQGPAADVAAGDVQELYR